MEAELPGDVTAINAEIARLKEELAGSLELPNEEWIRQSGPFRSVQEFFNSSFQNFRELRAFTGLAPRHRVLDYGCGLARLAIPLSAYLDQQHGAYCGVDTDRDCIERNRAAFADMENFRFEHVDIYSKMYNRKGGGFKTLLRQDFGDPFDLTFLFSVFTHILPEHCDFLLRFLRSQLADQGEFFSSWFLLNEATLEAIDSGLAHRKFRFTHGAARIDNFLVPEGAVAYQEADVVSRMEEAGFTDVRIHFGKWRGNLQSWVWQDIVVARAATRPVRYDTQLYEFVRKKLSR